LRCVRFTAIAGSLALLAVIAAACGSSSDEVDVNLDELSEVIEQLQANFIDRDRLSDAELNKAAIEGILDYLDDPYTSYLTQEQYDDFNASLSGGREAFEGIGAEVTLRNDRIMILGPLPDSPASRAGIRPGDIILEVDGVDVEGFGLPETVELIRGPKESTVVLRILRAGSLRPIDVSIVRDTIELSSVLARIQEDGIGYIRVSTFDAATTDGVRDAIASLRAEGAKGLILDLRNNTGGLVDAAVAMVSEFVESGLVFQWRNSDGTTGDFEVTGEGTAFDLPLVVLVNSFSASASEIVSGSLQDHDRATIVGTKTFGKGSVNLLSPLDSGAGLYLTTAKWATPLGRLIEGEGLDPDVLVGTSLDIQAAQRVGTLTRSLCDAFDEERERLTGQDALIGALSGLCDLGGSDGPVPQDDEQLDVAVAELRKAMAK
jgi:carboxyl-terminal processing protease